jgi:hypothetical protein
MSDYLSQRRYVREYDTEYDISLSTFHDMIYRAWRVTPSKNQYMPYKVHVLGKQHKKEKQSIYQLCLESEGKLDGRTTDELYDERYNKRLPAYSNILSCSYLLIFTLRVEDKPNNWQNGRINRGHKDQQLSQEGLLEMEEAITLEVGLFADALSNYCLEKDIDVSFTGCFPRNVNQWKDFPYVDNKPLLLMTVGKGKVYQDTNPENKRPDFDRIVNFVGSNL